MTAEVSRNSSSLLQSACQTSPNVKAPQPNRAPAHAYAQKIIELGISAVKGTFLEIKLKGFTKNKYTFLNLNHFPNIKDKIQAEPSSIAEAAKIHSKIISLQTHLKLNPQDIESRANLVHLHLQLNQIPKAEQEYTEAKNLNYWHHLVHYCEYSIQREKGVSYDLNDAKQLIFALRRTLAIQPKFEEALNALGSLEFMLQIKWRAEMEEGTLDQAGYDRNVVKLKEFLNDDPFKNEPEARNTAQRKLSPEFLKAYPQYQAQQPQSKATSNKLNLYITSHLDNKTQIYIKSNEVEKLLKDLPEMLDDAGNSVEYELVILPDDLANQADAAIEKFVREYLIERKGLTQATS